MINRILTILVLSITTFATIAHAENLIYFGLGSADEATATTTKDKPFTLGYLSDLKNLNLAAFVTFACLHFKQIQNFL